MSTATTRRIALPIDGMSCAACAARIERTLNRLDGVQASVNYATERAAVEYDPARLTPSSLVEAVAGIGYEARLPHEAAARDDASAGLRTRLVVSAALSVPVLVLGMAPGTAWGGRQWLALALATPVVLWGGRPFHHAAWTSLRHRAATMDTLVSLGTLVAWGWSLVAIAFLGAGSDGAAMGLSLTSSNDGVYLEPAALVVTFLLAGRFFEARAKRRAGAALLALAGLGAKDVALVASDGGERLAPVAELRVGDLFVVRPGERIAADGIVTTGSSAIDRSLLTGESTPLDVGPGDEVAGATVNLGGRLVVRAQRVGSETALARITALVEEAQVGEGSGAAARRPGGGGVRPDRARACRRHIRRVARERCRAGVRALGLGRRPDRRLPLRARAGDADRAPRRHRARRPAGHPDPWAGGARVDAADRHGGARQDGHRDPRAGRRSSPSRRRRARPRPRRCGSQAPSRRPRSIRPAARSPPPQPGGDRSTPSSRSPA